ncbi:hypothetical protein [Mycobacterium lepromatosis]|uniref:hypothetical protein n=1 Tax=Mycobacterium lepromatosis TaxID=480418 RepID=UPI003CFC1B94
MRGGGHQDDVVDIEDRTDATLVNVFVLACAAQNDFPEYMACARIGNGAAVQTTL